MISELQPVIEFKIFFVQLGWMCFADDIVDFLDVSNGDFIPLFNGFMHAVFMSHHLRWMCMCRWIENELHDDCD
ncbi:MAG: hypothetical protein AUI84_00915 [Delftia sp. 13_1_40CM_3_66_6]|nr:MAG: hypothetical protein AUI84_00915 [Delftia sp. 13_1_40CM_3_66_6]